jgi:DNA polymerase-3 subunit gamma/tau
MAAGHAVAAAPAVATDPAPSPDPEAPHPEASDPEAPAGPPAPESFADVVALCSARREVMLVAALTDNAHLVHFEPGRIELRPTPHAPANLANRLGALLSEWTGRRWVVSISSAAGAPTLGQQAAAAAERQRGEIMAHPLVQAVMAAFPGAAIEAVHDRRAGAGPDGSAGAPDAALDLPSEAITDPEGAGEDMQEDAE